jgi:hypothetical protein
MPHDRCNRRGLTAILACESKTPVLKLAWFEQQWFASRISFDSTEPNMTDFSGRPCSTIWTHLLLAPALVALLGLGHANVATGQDYPYADSHSYVPENAFFVNLGGSLNSVDFGEQDVIAVGTSVLTDGGVVVASGSAGPPSNTPDGTPIQMDTQISFGPQVQVGYFEHFGDSDWLWGFKCAYDYTGMTSTSRRPIFPQVGTFTEGVDPPVPFTGNAVALSTQTEVAHQISFRPFIGQSFERAFVYVGGGPTVSRERAKISQLVGFADINGNRGDMSGAPQDFSTSSWVWGGSAEVGATYFLDHSWFIDCSYVLGITGKHAFDYSSTFSSTFVASNGDVLDQNGTLVGNSSWNAITQGIGIRIGRAF